MFSRAKTPPLPPATGGLLRALLAMVFGALACASGFLLLAYGEARMNRGVAVARATNLNEKPAQRGASVTLTGGLDYTVGARDVLLEGQREGAPAQPIEWAYINRAVETCAWVEERPKGSKSATPVYKKRWVRDVPDSAKFRARGYDNPKPALVPQEVFAEALRIEDHPLALPIRVLGAELLAPGRARAVGARLTAEQWTYFGGGKECHGGSAAVGDQRVSFRVLERGDLMTVYGILRGVRIEAAAETVVLAKGSRQALLDSMERQKSPYAWFFRLSGGLLLWLGLTLVISPAVRLVAWLPILGGVARGATRLATIIVALLITLGVVYQGYGMNLVARLFGGAFG